MKFLMFLFQERERERLRKIEQKRLSYYTYTGMSPFNLLEKYSFSYLFIYKIDKDKGERNPEHLFICVIHRCLFTNNEI